MAQQQSKYFHMEPTPGSFESFCLRCFQTIGIRACEADLRIDEREHKCSGLPLCWVQEPPERRT